MSESQFVKKNIVLKNINDNFAYSRLGNYKIIIMKNNDFINASQLCIICGRQYKNWKRNSNSKELINKIEKIIENPIISNKKGTHIVRGSYVHPLILTDICRWISTDFSIKISLWIEEWKSFSEDNNYKYYSEISKMKPDNKSQPEAEYQKVLYEKIGGEIEVKTEVGRIDLLTDSKLIEIKNYTNWMCSWGQLHTYGIYYPDHKKYLYLFDVDGDLDKIKKIVEDKIFMLDVYKKIDIYIYQFFYKIIIFFFNNSMITNFILIKIK